MSAALKSYIPVPVPKTKRSRPALDRALSPIAPAVPSPSTQHPSLPPQIQGLSRLQKGISAITFALLGTTLGIYAWTVYIPKVWDREFDKLETLQHHERHLLATNETLKHQLAQQAEKPEMGLGNPQPFQTIFLSRSTNTTLKPVRPVTPYPTELITPKAY